MQSEWAGLFIDWKKFWGGEPSRDDVEKIYTRKPHDPVKDIEHGDGTKRRLWCTFSEEQVDMDVFGEAGDKYIGDQLATLADKCALCYHIGGFPDNTVLVSLLSQCLWGVDMLGDVGVSITCWKPAGRSRRQVPTLISPMREFALVAEVLTLLWQSVKCLQV